MSIRSLCLIVLFLTILSCFSEKKSTETEGSPSVETLPQEAIGQMPAFEGQTRVMGIQTVTNFQIDTIVTGLNRPWGLDFLPDNRIIVTEKPGRIRLIQADGTLGDSLLGVPRVFFKQDGGMMDIAVDPTFGQNRFLYFAYAETRDTGYVPAIARGTLSIDETRLEAVRVIYRAEPAIGSVMHYGTKLLFDKSGFLFATIGERFEPRVRVRAQELNSSFGKVIRIDSTGKAAPENPFMNRDGALPEIWALGFRDPQGICFHPITGELWLSDHGPRAGDEINVVKAGSNYGWPLISYGLEYDRTPVNGGLTQTPGMEQPVYYWDPAVAPAGICIYSGALIPEWKNQLFVASLRGKHLIRLSLDGNKVTGEERLLMHLEQRWRGVTEGPDGALYLWNDEANGAVIRIRQK